MRLFEGTEFDRPPRCEECGELEEECVCPSPEPVRTPPSEQRLKVRTEKRKKGKLATVVSGLADEPETTQELLTSLKTSCGAGGTVKNGQIEIQGSHVERVTRQLKQLGYRVS